MISFELYWDAKFDPLSPMSGGEWMFTIKEIESAIKKLSKPDLSKFRTWYEAFDAEKWDKQLEEDVLSGKLDKLANQSISDYKAGKG